MSSGDNGCSLSLGHSQGRLVTYEAFKLYPGRLFDFACQALRTTSKLLPVTSCEVERDPQSGSALDLDDGIG